MTAARNSQNAYRWLVTGGAGFIGSSIVRLLLQQNQQVTVVDDFSAGKRTNLPHKHPLLNIRKGSILDLSFLKSCCQKTDFILHHAALVSVPLSIQKPNETFTINVQGTANVLQAAKENQVRRVVFASTCAVYGPGDGHPLAENAPLHPQTPYALSKQQGEELCRSYRALYGLDYTVLRYFNVYGPGQNAKGPYSAVVAKFLECAKKGEPLPLDSTGRQTRDFIFVEDVARANLWAALYAKPAETYNIGTGKSESLLKLAALIQRLSGKNIQRVFRPKRVKDIQRSQADISKLRAAGFCPGIDLACGLKYCWEQYNKRL